MRAGGVNVGGWGAWGLDARMLFMLFSSSVTISSLFTFANIDLSSSVFAPDWLQFAPPVSHRSVKTMASRLSLFGRSIINNLSQSIGYSSVVPSKIFP